MQKKLVTQTRFSYIVWHWTQWICFVLVKEWKMVNAWLRGENFPIKQRERILSAYPEFSFKSSLLWFAPRILAITCATRFMDSKNNVLMKPLSNAQQRFQAPPRGGGTRDFKWRGWSNGAKSQDPKKSLGLPAKPKKIPGPKIKPKKIPCRFLQTIV